MSVAGLFVCLTLFYARIKAQDIEDVQPGMLLRANDGFALDLLKTAHSESADRNIVIAPLPISLVFGALWLETPDSSKELEAAFHWDRLFDHSVAARMTLARFTRPKPNVQRDGFKLPPVRARL